MWPSLNGNRFQIEGRGLRETGKVSHSTNVSVLECPGFPHWPYVELPDAPPQPESTKACATRTGFAELFFKLRDRSSGHDDVDVSRPPGLALEDSRYQKRPERPAEHDCMDLEPSKIFKYSEDRLLPGHVVSAKEGFNFLQQPSLESCDSKPIFH